MIKKSIRNGLLFPIFPLIFLGLVIACAPAPPAGQSDPTKAAEATPVPESDSTVTPAGDEILGETETAPPTTVPAPDRPGALATITPEPTAAVTSDRQGALIDITMTSRVGVLLDDYPADLRDDVAALLLEQPEEAWLARAVRQVHLTRNRLNFRNFLYEGKGQLPLPPEPLWDITLDEDGPSREEIQGHDLIMIGYTLHTTLLTDEASPGAAESALAEEGGVWREPFIFPADPDYLLQRTGNACLNEGGFPANSFDAENADHFYDFGCTADSTGPAGCHRTQRPFLSCREALVSRIGEVATGIDFERLPWETDLADAVRLEEVTNLDGPDLAAVASDLWINRVVYRHFAPADCAIEENAVGGTGWRRLLLFEATVANVGGQPLHIGRANVEDNDNHVFTYSACHDHFHYSNYGAFFLEDGADQIGSKQAFCVQSTTRMANSELSPLIHDYSCSFQGIQTGWADEYIAGLDAQWIDITDVEVPPEGLTVELGFASNEDQFLCEGDLVVDENGEQLWEFSGFFAEDGHMINRPVCEFIDEWEINNVATAPVVLPAAGTYITEPCDRLEVDPFRNCGFAENEAVDTVCQPGEDVTLRIPELPADPQLVRVCERSAALDTGLACSAENALSNSVVTSPGQTISFTCPVVRDAEELTGGFSLYITPLFPQ